MGALVKPLHRYDQGSFYPGNPLCGGHRGHGGPPNTPGLTLPGLFLMPDGRLPMQLGRCPMLAGPLLTPRTTCCSPLPTLWNSTSSNCPCSCVLFYCSSGFDLMPG